MDVILSDIYHDLCYKIFLGIVGSALYLLYITNSEVEATATCAVREPLAMPPVAHAACNLELGYL